MSSSRLFRITLALAVVACGANALAWWLGLDSGGAAVPRGYLQLSKLNWALHPLFFLVLGWLVHRSWAPFVKAWKSLPMHGVVLRDGEELRDPEALEPFVARLEWWRPRIIASAVVLGLALSAWDAGCLWREYSAAGVIEVCDESDFSVAYRLEEAFPGVSKQANRNFLVLAYALQGALGAYGLVALFQLVLHGVCFWRFEHLSWPEKEQLELRLNSRDPLNEFGLSEVNRALNSVYFFLALGMIVPVLSAYSQEPGSVPDEGQLLLGILVPIILLAPLLIPVADRFSRQERESERVAASGDAELAESFTGQRLWPLDRTQASYVGKAALGIVAAEYSYVFGSIAGAFLKGFGG